MPSNPTTTTKKPPDLVRPTGGNVDSGSVPLVAFRPLHAPDEIALSTLAAGLHVDVEQVDMQAKHVVVEGQAALGIVGDLGAHQACGVIWTAWGRGFHEDVPALA